MTEKEKSLTFTYVDLRSFGLAGVYIKAAERVLLDSVPGNLFSYAPAFFCFKHALELGLKTLHKEKNNHSTNILIKDFEKRLGIKFTDDEIILTEEQLIILHELLPPEYFESEIHNRHYFKNVLRKLNDMSTFYSFGGADSNNTYFRFLDKTEVKFNLEEMSKGLPSDIEALKHYIAFLGVLLIENIRKLTPTE